jgi:hypothetical protein
MEEKHQIVCHAAGYRDIMIIQAEGLPVDRYRWFGIRILCCEWWGAFLYDFGVALYTAADIFTYISVCPDTQLSHNLYVSTCPSIPVIPIAMS